MFDKIQVMIDYLVASIKVNQEGNHRVRGLRQRDFYPATHVTYDAGMLYLPFSTILVFLRRFMVKWIERAPPASTNDPFSHHLSDSSDVSASSFTQDANHPPHPPNGYSCTTEDNGTSSLAFNMTRKGSIPAVHRFQPGSTLFYFIGRRNISPQNFHRLRVAMHTAAYSWNLCKMGVRFQEVRYPDKAVFHVVHHPNMGSDTYAKAFFPSDYNSDYNNTIAVGPLSFEPGNIGFLSNVLCHELGHVLGIRHTKWETTEPSQAAVYFPTRELDEASVMNSALAHTLALLVISEKDAEEVRQLYSLAEGLHGSDAPGGEFLIRNVCVKRAWDEWRV